MNLKEIMAIAGKPGLYKMIAQAKNGLVVESIIDQKRIQAFTHDKISTLEEISIYTESDDMPLREVLKTIFEKLEGKPAPDNKGDNVKTKQFFGEMIPSYDKERVYISHMQKIISWYNLLLEHNLIDTLEEEEKVETKEEAIENTEVVEATPAKEVKTKKEPKAKTEEGVKAKAVKSSKTDTSSKEKPVDPGSPAASDDAEKTE